MLSDFLNKIIKKIVSDYPEIASLPFFREILSPFNSDARKCLEFSRKKEAGAFRKAIIYPSQINYLVIILTHRCNLNCKYCLRDATGRNEEAEINFETLEQIILSAHRAGCRSCGITGGETLLYSRLKDLINLLGILGWHVWFETNGKILTADFCDYLKEKLKDNFLIFTSLDSHKKNNHDALRGRGSFDLAVRAIKLTKSRNIKLITNAVITPQNYMVEKDLSGYISFNRGLGVNEVHLNRVVAFGRGENKEFSLSAPQITEFYNILKKYNFFNNYVSGEAFNFRNFGCQRIRQEICVSPAGLHPCVFQEGIKIGELKDFKDIIWKRELFELMFSAQATVCRKYSEKDLPFSCVECAREVSDSLPIFFKMKLL